MSKQYQCKKCGKVFQPKKVPTYCKPKYCGRPCARDFIKQCFKFKEGVQYKAKRSLDKDRISNMHAVLLEKANLRTL